ncbi:MAG: hypothetical protein HZA08_06455 [Nitrospirae bacterium]|nr:hypothetical protein [Nitrospirota bacterium]
MTKKIKVGISTLTESANRFIDAWHKSEQREPVREEELLNFEDIDTLLRVLTPVRWTLLQSLRREGPMSIRSLSKLLERDYKNVHTDVQELMRIGLLTPTKDGLIMVPWDTIIAEVRLAAA